MLKSLSIKNVAVIEEVNIDFQKGLSILSGETGAGKSIIIDSINLLKGERGSKGIIRTGCDKARVSGVFELELDTAAKIADIIGSDADEELIITREMGIDGKNTIRINGIPANLSMLKSVGELLINIHGQHDNTSLLSPKTHIGYLDSFGGDEISAALADYRVYFNKCRSISDALAEIDTDEQEKLRRMDMLSYQISELEDASLTIGEDESLMARKNVLDNSARIKENTQRAYDSLYGADSGTMHDKLWEAINLLEKVAPFDADIDGVYQSLSDMADSLGESVRSLRQISDNMNFDDEELDTIEERLELIQTLKRKYGSTIEEILEFYNRASEELTSIETSTERAEALQKELEDAKRELKKKAEHLRSLREIYAKKLSDAVVKELCELNMEKVAFMVDIANTESYKANGTEEVQFMIRTNIGEQMAPLSKIASGGELSRIMLAIKTVLLSLDSVKVSVFDEIDVGVSGAAAQKIGEKLHRMAKDALVLCITHLPQISAMADNHYLIEKSVTDGRTSTSVRELGYDDRVDEIARLLGGSYISEAARENARELLKKNEE